MKNIYEAKILNADLVAGRYSSKVGFLALWSLESKGVSWSSYLFIPDLTSTDKICFDILFDDDFRKDNDIKTGDRYQMTSSEGPVEIEITGIRQGEPVNNIENKVPWKERSPFFKGE